VEATLTFVVPRTGSAIAVDYLDPADGQPLTVAEGTVDQAPAGASDEHPHSGAAGDQAPAGASDEHPHSGASDEHPH
jgi:hypothetical protein